LLTGLIHDLWLTRGILDHCRACGERGGHQPFAQKKHREHKREPGDLDLAMGIVPCSTPLPLITMESMKCFQS
jgi:hypothetical protein